MTVHALGKLYMIAVSRSYMGEIIVLYEYRGQTIIFEHLKIIKNNV